MFVVLNLFLAILLNNFSGLTEDDDDEPEPLASEKLEPESPGGSAGGKAKPARRVAVGGGEAETETTRVKPLAEQSEGSASLSERARLCARWSSAFANSAKEALARPPSSRNEAPIAE